MNLKTKYMTRKSFIATFIICILSTFSAFGQQLKKSEIGSTIYAVFYSTGMPESAIWPLGMKLSKNGHTIRHTSLKALEGNMNINNKVPFRFIIAPKEGTSTSWANAMGLSTTANNELEPGGDAEKSGCANYSTDEFSSGWRLPTQREMMLMWLFREGINGIYPGGKIGNDSEKRYWTATESSANQAWYLDFNAIAPASSAYIKTNDFKYRCVRDY